MAGTRIPCADNKSLNATVSEFPPTIKGWIAVREGSNCHLFSTSPRKVAPTIRQDAGVASPRPA